MTREAQGMELSLDDLFSELLLARSPAQRLAMSADMFSTAKSLACAGILAEHGPVSPGELRALVFRRLYEQDFSESEIARIIHSWKAA